MDEIRPPLSAHLAGHVAGLNSSSDTVGGPRAHEADTEAQSSPRTGLTRWTASRKVKTAVACTIGGVVTAGVIVLAAEGWGRGLDQPSGQDDSSQGGGPPEPNGDAPF